MIQKNVSKTVSNVSKKFAGMVGRARGQVDATLPSRCEKARFFFPGIGPGRAFDAKLLDLTGFLKPVRSGH